MKSTLLTVGLALLVVLGYYLGRYLYLKPKNIAGEKAMEIIGQLPDGKNFALSGLKGHYVLIDFWGSWCGPCREGHPQMVEMYQRFQNQDFKDSNGFEIVSIGIERDRSDWERVILSDQLSWPYHLLETESFESPKAKAYNVKQIPTKFLINPDGIIIAVNPTLDEIAKVLESRLKRTS